MILGNRWTEVPLDHVVKNVGFFGFLFYLLLLTLKKRIHRQLIVESFLIFGNLSKRDYKILTKKKKTDQSLTVFRLKHCRLLGSS